MKIIKFISLLLVFTASRVSSQPCEFKGNNPGQQVKLDDIITSMKANNCQKLILTNIDLTCDGTVQTINDNKLIELHVNDIEINNSQILCDNLEIDANEVTIQDTAVGIPKQGKCCSFMNQYNFYVFAAGNVNLKGKISHQKQKYGMIMFNSQKSFNIIGADISAGNLAFHSMSQSIISNSKLASQFIYCHDDYQTMSKKEKFAPEKLMQIKMVKYGSQTVAEFQVSKIAELAQLSNLTKTEYSVLYSSLKYYYSLLLYSESSISITDNTNISGSRIASFSVSASISANSKIDSTGLGCPANYGLGKGLYLDTVQQCSPNGASQASFGGIGLPKPNQDGTFSQDDLNSCIFFLQQSSFVLQNIPYTYQNVYEGSGGAYSDQQKYFSLLDTEGAGGGLITIYTSKEVIVDGLLQSNGNSLEKYSGSGASGGAVTVKANKIHGTGTITVNGGDSDLNGLSGEGAGGMVTLYQLDWDIDSNINQFNGTINIDKGARDFSQYTISEEAINLVQASQGTFVSFICPAGYEPQSNGLCKQCDAGYYKSGLVGKCRKCNKPVNFDRVVKEIKHQTQFNSLSDCFQNCDEFNCDPLRFYVRNVISLKGIPYLLVYLFILCFGYISRRILRMKTKKIDSIPIQHVKYDYDDSIFARECKEKDIFFYRDLLYHKYRLQFYGENNINSQWYLQPQIPEGTEQIFDQRDFAEFALKINQTLKWKKIDILFLKMLNYIYYPLYWYFLSRVQKKVYKKVLNKIHDEPYPKFLKGSNVVHQKYIRMKITKSDDYTLLYLDLFNYNKRNQNYFKKTMPTIIHFSGEGSYLKPYYIWPRDHFLQSVFYSSNSKTMRNKGNQNDVNVFCDNYKYHMENSKSFEFFITELNKISSTIDFYSHKPYLVQCFQEMIALCNDFNQSFLYQLGLKLHILIMEIPFNDPFDVNSLRISSQLQHYAQTYKQRITLIEDQKSEKFLEAIERIQQYKIYQKPIDIKLSMFIFSTVEDVEDLQKHLIPELEIEQEQNRYEFQSQLNQNPFGSAAEYQSTKMSKLDYNLIQNSFVGGKEDYSINRNSLNKQSMAEFMQNCIEQQNNQLNEQEKNQEEKIAKKINKKEGMLNQISIKVGIFMGFVRFLFLSHKNSKTDKEILIYTLTTLIILDLCTMTFFFNNIYYAKIEEFFEFDYYLVFFPFPLAIVLTPFLGLFLLTNQSYGMGKAYQIFNFMSLITMAISLLLTLCFIPIDGFHFPIIALKLCNLIVKIFISNTGKYSLLALNKLNKTNMYKK